MSRVYVCGLGAVSPAGWGLQAMRAALEAGKPLPIETLERPPSANPSIHPSIHPSTIHHPPSGPAGPSVRLVPPCAERSALLGHPRLRRASPLSQYAAAAALEAISQFRRSLEACGLRTEPGKHQTPVSVAVPAPLRLGATSRRRKPNTKHPSEDRGLRAETRSPTPTPLSINPSIHQSTHPSSTIHHPSSLGCAEPGRGLGLIVCLQSGPVQYVSRFLEEIQKDPATASPVIFPETVFAAPASHVAAVLGGEALAYTLLGDPASFLQGVAMASQWLDDYDLEACLVVGAQEINWLHAEALWIFQHDAVASAGAGALCLARDPARSLGVELESVTDAHTFSPERGPAEAAKKMRAQLRQSDRIPAPLKDAPTGALLCDGQGGTRRANQAEQAAWQGWQGARLSAKRILGEGLMAASAWQCVAACDAVASGRFESASVSLVGADQQAIGATFRRLS